MSLFCDDGNHNYDHYRKSINVDITAEVWSHRNNSNKKSYWDRRRFCTKHGYKRVNLGKKMHDKMFNSSRV